MLSTLTFIILIFNLFGFSKHFAEYSNAGTHDHLKLALITLEGCHTCCHCFFLFTNVNKHNKSQMKYNDLKDQF